MDQGLIDLWNDTVKGRAIVYILGDFAWKNHMKYFHKLNGKKILVKGNHDKMSQLDYSNFTKIYDGLADIKINKQRITLCHYPMMSWNASCHAAYHLYGHVHNNPFVHPSPLALNVGVDVNRYRPMNYEIIHEILTGRFDEWVEWKNNFRKDECKKCLS